MVRAILLCIVAWGMSVGVRELYAAESEGEKREAPIVAGQAWEARIEAALQKKVAVSFRETPLREFVSWLGETTGELCLLDHRSLEDVGVADDVPLNAEFQAISVRSTLNLVLRDLGLTWVLRDGALVITSQEDVESTLLVEVFDVGDLVRPIPPGKADVNADQLIDLITATVAPQSWDTVGGPGTIAAFRGGLVISQTREVCAQIRDLLAQYREAKRIAEQHPATAPPVAVVGLAAIRPEEAAIHAVLDREASFEFEGTALKDVAAYIQKTHKIPVVLDVKALDDIGTDRSQPVTFPGRPHPIAAGLDPHPPPVGIDLRHP